MENVYFSEQTEMIALSVEWSPIWEVIVGIAGYTHAQLRHTFDLDNMWKEHQQAMPEVLVKDISTIRETNLWYGLVMLQTKLNASSIQDFSNQLLQLSKEAFYETLLPYKNRQTESMRKKAAGDRSLIGEYATHFIEHYYLGGYVQALARYSHHELRQVFMSVVTEWENWISEGKEWGKWMQALNFEMKKYQSLDAKDPIQEITRITEGIHYIPEPSIWNIKLIPHVSYRPWILELRTVDTKLFFYPLNEAYLLEPGEPSVELLHGHKALGDELRLKLLYQLQRGPLSLQEMSSQFHLSKTTLHHHLSLLKAAKFILVDKGIYCADRSRIDAFSMKLKQYLGDTNE